MTKPLNPKQERSARLVSEIIRAMEAGCITVGEIADETSYSLNTIYPRMDWLIELGRVISTTESRPTGGKRRLFALTPLHYAAGALPTEPMLAQPEPSDGRPARDPLVAAFFGPALAAMREC